MNSPRQVLWRWNPRLRVSSQSQGGEQVFVVQDPASGDYYQLGADEYEIARSFDGSRGLEDVRAALAAAGVELDDDDLAGFVAQLAEAAILIPASGAIGSETSGSAPGARTAPGPRSGLGRLLYVQLAAFQPMRFFDRTLRWVRPLLGAPALVAGLGVVLLAVHVLAGNLDAMRDALAARFSGGVLLLAWFGYGVVVLVHEMAHGYVCTHFGGRVQALGFLLMYGKPCAYCDVSDAWLFPRKSHKIWVMAAGSLVELFLWAVSTLVWRVTAPETWLHHGALVLMAVCGIGTLFNFNPLLKFDGYYMLSDALEIPNLRERAFRDLGRLLRGRRREAATARERLVFPVYAILALVYSALVLGFIFLRLQGWVHERWGGPGLLLVWGAVGIGAARPLQHGLAVLGRSLGSATRSRKVHWLAGTAVLVAILGLVRWPLKVASECRIEPLARVLVRSPIAANVDSVLAREGDAVRAGQLLVRLDTRDLDFALLAAGAEVRELEARLALLESGARQEELEIARRRVEAASTRVEYDRRAHQRAVRSFRSDLVSRESVEAAERALRLSEDEERSARNALQLMQAGSRPEEIGAMRARLEAVRSEVVRLEDERGRAPIRAPIHGKVLTAHVERLRGRYVERGDSLLVLADLSAVLLEIPVPEKDVGDVFLGAPVRFKARSHPARVFEGRVVEIAPAAQESAHQRTVLVRSRIDNEAGLLRADASGFAKIYCGDRPLGVILARRGVRMLRTEFWALW